MRVVATRWEALPFGYILGDLSAQPPLDRVAGVAGLWRRMPRIETPWLCRAKTLAMAARCAASFSGSGYFLRGTPLRLVA
jgi:hypothetical protein